MPQSYLDWIVFGLVALGALQALGLAVAGVAKVVALKYPPAQVVVDVCSKLCTDIGYIRDLLGRLVGAISPKTKAVVTLLVVGALAWTCPSCGLVRVGARTPCEGLYCVSLEVIGAPGAALVCYDSETVAKAVMARERCTLQPQDTAPPRPVRAVCPAGKTLEQVQP